MKGNSKFSILVVAIYLLNNSAFAKENQDNIEALLKELNNQIKDLKTQVDRSNSRINQLENELQQQVFKQEKSSTDVTVPPMSGQSDTKSKDEKKWVAVGDVKGTIKIPGTDTSIGIGGYVKTDVIYNSVSAGRDRFGDQQIVFSQIPVGGAPGEHSQIAFHAKESRLWFKSFTPSSWGDINTYLEMDFYGDSGSYTYIPRLRHAYGSLGNLLAGQTWTTFLNSSALPDHLDIGGTAGQISSLRQPMVRWTQPFVVASVPLEFQFAVENPRTRIWVDPKIESGTKAASTDPNIDAYFTTPNSDRYPDIVSRINFTPEWGNISLSALGRQIRYTNNTGFQREEWGGAVGLAGKINTFGLDNIRFMAHYGNGQGRYISSPNTFADAGIDSTGNLELVTAYGAMLSYQRWYTKHWRSTLTYGFAQADSPLFVNKVLNKQIQSVHANLIWSPIIQAMLGVEYIYATRELIDGRNGDLHRVQFSAKYSF